MKTNNKILRTSAVATAIISALTAPLLYAQDNQTPNKTENEQLERISVRGFAASQEKNLNIKRFSDTIVDAISAEDVGKFPDQTVADALQRIPGVSVEKDFGESDKVSIRGTAPHLNMTLLNGQNVASATASASITTPSRGFNYSLLPAELVDTLEVYKSAEADIDEGSIGGTVVVRTRTPLKTENNYAAFSLKNIYQESSDKHSPILSGVYSWKNDNENFGVGLGYVYKDNYVQRDSREVRFGFRDVQVDGDTVKYPDSVGFNRFDSNNKLQTYSVVLEAAPATGWNLILNNLFSKVDNEGMGVYSGTFKRTVIGNIQNPVIVDGTVIGGTIPDSTGDEAIYGAAGYDGGYDTRTHDLKITHEADGYVWSAQVGHTKANGNVTDNYAEFYASTDIIFDLPSHNVNMPGITSAQDYALGYNHVNVITNTDKETYAQTDFKYQLDHDIFRAIKTGVKYRDHSKSSDLHKTTYPASNAARLDQFTHDLADDFMGSGQRQNYLYEFDLNAWRSYLDASTPSASYNHLLYYYNIEEKISSAYVKADFEWDKLRGNVGVRYAKTKLATDGWRYTGAVQNTQDKTLYTIENDYSDVLPSLNLNYSLQDDVIIRFAAAKVMSRPDYQHLTSQRTYSVSQGNNTGSGGNPYLKPYRASQYDISAEWYFSPTSILSVAYFYKDIDSYITNDYVIESLPDDQGVYHDVEIRLPVNGLGGTNQGLEFNISHNFGSGFGVLANYTYSEADMEETEAQILAGKKAVLPNNSRHTYNLTAYYEQDAFSARLSYNYRSEYFYGEYLGLSQYLDGFGQFDLTFDYSINDNISLNLQAINLTDEEQVRHFGDANRPIGTFNFGRRILAGVQVRF